MSESIGKALESAIKDEEKPIPTRGGRHIFLNSHRRCIFSILTKYPCMGIKDLASKCGIASNSIEWHMDILIKSGYVVKHNIGKRKLFFPDGLITHEEAEFFRTINSQNHSDVLRAVIDKPGSSQIEIAGSLGKNRQRVAKMLDNLETEGLMTAVAEGTHTRYYPTKLLLEKSEDFYSHSKEFSNYILRKLGYEGGKPPVVVKKNLERLIVEIGYASERFNLDIGINPYITCLGC